jgi:hypothetical protein
MTCEGCRAESEENDAEIECDTTGRPCRFRAIDLADSNFSAWNIFWAMRPESKGAVGNAIYDLMTLDLTRSEAGDLAARLEVIADEYAKIQTEQEKDNIAQMKREGRR